MENRTLLVRHILLIRRILLVLGRHLLVRVVRLRVLLVALCLIVRILITLPLVRTLRLSTRVVLGI